MSDSQPPIGPHPTSQLFVLICWREGTAPDGWRFTLVEGRSEARWSFRDLAALAAFLEARLAPDATGL